MRSITHPGLKKRSHSSHSPCLPMYFLSCPHFYHAGPNQHLASDVWHPASSPLPITHLGALSHDLIHLVFFPGSTIPDLDHIPSMCRPRQGPPPGFQFLPCLWYSLTPSYSAGRIATTNTRHTMQFRSFPVDRISAPSPLKVGPLGESHTQPTWRLPAMLNGLSGP